MNVVDCSPETIEREWQRIKVEHKVTQIVIPDEASDIPETVINSTGETITHAEWQDEKIETLKNWVGAALAGLFNGLIGLEVERGVFDEFALLTAQMAVKHYPNSSALEIIAKYELELKWVWATGMMCKALAAGFSEKKQKALQAQRQENTDTNGVSADEKEALIDGNE